MPAAERRLRSGTKSGSGASKAACRLSHAGPLRAVHPRDLLRQLVGLARYQTMPPQLIPLLMDQSANTYFVNITPKKA